MADEQRVRIGRIDMRCNKMSYASTGSSQTYGPCELQINHKEPCTPIPPQPSAPQVPVSEEVEENCMAGPEVRKEGTEHDKEIRRRINLGVVEFHSESRNPGFIKRFFAVVDDLRESASIADLWLMDFATVLGEFGYDMEIYKREVRKEGTER